jgi:hypothetical protein
MNSFKEIVLPVILLVLCVFAVVAILTWYHVSDFAADCRESGGEFSSTWADASCRY